jgi:hypothetical protein
MMQDRNGSDSEYLAPGTRSASILHPALCIALECPDGPRSPSDPFGACIDVETSLP